MNAAHKICYKFLVSPKHSYFLRHLRKGHHARCYYDIVTTCSLYGVKPREDVEVIRQLFNWGLIGFSEPPVKVVQDQASVDELLKSIASYDFSCFEDVFSQTKKVICDDWIYLIRDESIVSNPVIAVAWSALQQEYIMRYKLVI